MSTEKSNNKSCTLCKRLGLKPFTKNNILFYYTPICSMATYGALSVNVMSPAIFTRLFPKRDLTNFLMVHTLVGSAFYIYSRPHLQSIEPKKRAVYSVLGSSLFGLGSILCWAILRSALPNHTSVCTAVGLTSGFLIAKLSYDYMDHVDSLVVSKST